MNDGKKVVTLTLNVVKSCLINNLEKFRGVIWLNRLLMTTFRVKLTITHMISGLCIDAIPNLTAYLLINMYVTRPLV